MRKLNIIKNFFLIAQFLLIAGALFVCHLAVTTEPEIFWPIGEPNLKITSRSAQDQMYPYIPKPSGDPIILIANKVDFSMQATWQLRLFVVAMALGVVGYFVLILEIFRWIIDDVKGGNSFNRKNIRRVKIVGVLVLLAPVLEFFLRKAFMFWIETRFTFKEMVLTSEADLGWFAFIIGLLIVVLGVAFEQGSKIQEENELTV